MDDCNAANESITNVNTEKGCSNEINEKKETLDEVSTKLKNTDKVNSEKKCVDKGNADARNQANAEKETTDERNARKNFDEKNYCDSQNTDVGNAKEEKASKESNVDEKIPAEVNAEGEGAPAEVSAAEGAPALRNRIYLVYENLYHASVTMQEVKRRHKKAFYLAHNLYLYVKRIYDTLKGGRSDISETNIHLPEDLISEFRSECSYESYVLHTNLAEYRHISSLENRDQMLFSTLKRKFENLGHNYSPEKLMYMSASCFYIALDLEEYERFEGASECALSAVGSAFCDGDIDLLVIFDSIFDAWEVADSTIDAFFENRGILLEYVSAGRENFQYISTRIVFLK